MGKGVCTLDSGLGRAGSSNRKPVGTSAPVFKTKSTIW